jgi:HEAT repeat protein
MKYLRPLPVLFAFLWPATFVAAQDIDLNILRKVAKDADPELRAQAVEALGRSNVPPEQVVPLLLEALKDEDPRVRVKALESFAYLYVEKMPRAGAVVSALVKTLKEERVDVCVLSARALALPSLGPEAAKAVPALTERLKHKDSRVRAQSAEALGQIGSKDRMVVAALLEMLHKEQTAELLFKAADALIRIQPEAPAVDSLMTALDEPERTFPAAEALARLSRKEPKVLPALIVALQGDRALTRAHAAFTLRELVRAPFPGEVSEGEARLLVPALKNAIDKEKGEVRLCLIEALGCTGSQGGSALAALQKLLPLENAPASSEGCFAAAAVLKIEPNDPRALGVLAANLMAEDGGTRALALELWQEAQPRGPAAVVALEKVFTSKDASIRRSALGALRDMGTEPMSHRLVAAALTDKDIRVRKMAVGVLGTMGKPKPIILVDVLPAPTSRCVECLVEALNEDKDGKVRAQAAASLGQVAPTGREAIPPLTRALGDENLEVRIQAARSLGQFGPAAREAEPTLRALLAETPRISPALRVEAVTTLVALKPKTDASAKALLEALRDPQLREPTATAMIFDDFIPPKTLTWILADLKDPKAEVRQQAATILGDLGVVAKYGSPATIPALTAALNDSDTQVRRLAFVAYLSFKGSLQDRPMAAPPTTPVWSPPPWCASEELNAMFFGPVKLQDVYQRLLDSLHGANYTETSLFPLSDGFALATRIERIDKDGTPILNARWTRNRLVALSLRDWVRMLFLQPVGYYRLFLFVVVKGDLENSGEPLTIDEADSWFGVQRELPSGLAGVDCKDHNCHMLVYHFIKEEGAPIRLVIPSGLPGKEHLLRGGIWQKLTGMP